MRTQSSRVIPLSMAFLLTSGFLVGCGSTFNTQTTTSQSDTNQQNAGTQYQGKSHLDQYVQVAQGNPQNYNDQLQAGIANFQNNQPQDAISFYMKAAQIDSKNGVPYNDIGNVYRLTLKDKAKAAENYQKAVDIEPDLAYAWYNLARTQYELGQEETAKNTAKKAIGVLPKTTDSMLLTGLQSIAGGKNN